MARKTQKSSKKAALKKSRKTPLRLRAAVQAVSNRKKSSRAKDLGSYSGSIDHVLSNPVPNHMLRFPVVAIGASAGGIEAYIELFENTPANIGMAFVLILHLSRDRESLLPEILKRSSGLKVFTAKNGMALKPNCVYVIPHDVNLAISKGKLTYVPRPKHAGQNMPIDIFMRALAEDQKSNAIGVILSGADSDGSLGMRAIKAEGGITFAQDPNSAKVPNMPEAAIRVAAPVDFVLRPLQIGQELARLSEHPYLAEAAKAENLVARNNEDLNKIFYILKTQKGVDFSGYKLATLGRRIKRRMILQRLETLQSYFELLRTKPEEVELLYNDLLINVTCFFRDADTFKSLKDEVFPALIHNRHPGTPIRIWVPGCATGEEVYSLAICLMEFLSDRVVHFPIQIFATDLSEAAIDKARLGQYVEAVQLDVSPERLRKYFTRADGGYQINRTIRDMCVFARHDVTRDPPFSRMDLISCRNLLIYLGPVLQTRVLTSFSYALNNAGFLMLGNAETVGAASECFSTVDKKHRIYKRKPGPTRILLDMPPVLGHRNFPAIFFANPALPYFGK
ncbi:MAG: CheR family methyltransferase [Bdellovibrionales bacterium]